MRGTVRKPRTPGASWTYRIDYGLDLTGRRKQREVSGFRTKREAQAALNDAIGALQQGTYVAPTRTTLSAFLGQWIAGARSELALTAWTNYGEMIRRYIDPHLGSVRLSELTPLAIKQWHGTLLTRGRMDGGALAVSSVKLAHRVLHRALADAVRWNIIPVNPASHVRIPRAEPREMQVWTAEEARQFIERVADDRLACLWTLALHTGLRRGELAGLRWRDVDLANGTLTVAQQRTNANHQIVVSTPKARSHRQLLLAPSTVDVLQTHLERQREEARQSPVWTGTGYVFVDELGRPLHPTRLTKLFAEAIARTGLSRIRLHDTRHTMATLALSAGVHPKVVQEQLGHSTISVTLDTYSHVPQAVRRDGAERVAALFAAKLVQRTR